jgi:hypothetical protein
MDIASFAVGFALGRRKGGGGGYRDSVFHFILDNYVPVYTAVIDNTYTVKIGACLLYDGNFIKGQQSQVYGNTQSLFTTIYDRQTETRMYLVPPQARFAAVQVMYKNNAPIYAGWFNMTGNVNEDWGGWSTDSYSSAFIYKRKGDYKIESVASSSCTYFRLGNPAYSTSWGSYDYYTDLSFTMNLSYQEWHTQDTYEPRNVWVEKDGDRQTTTAGFNFSSSHIPVISYYGNFTDMTTGDFWDEIQNVYCAASTAAGYPTVPLVIKYPID